MSNQDTSRQIPDGLANHVKGIVIKPVDYQRVDVQINLAEGFDAFLEEYFEVVGQMLNQQGANEMPFTVEELRQYVVILIQSRVKWVRNERDFVLHYSERVAIPSLLSFMLSGIGRVELAELGIELLPKFEVDLGMTREQAKEWAIKFSNRLKPLQHSALALEFAEGYSRDKSGAFDMMVLQLIGDQVLSHTAQASPVYAVAAYFFGFLQVVNLMGPRVLYGTKEQMRMILRLVAAQ